ncbi:MAG: hypothetical protein ABIM98_06070 [candidate division WOR-3 bacterium]
MKKILILSGLFIAIIYFAACNGEEEIATPNARITQILNQGGGLRFEWDPVDGADGYRVYVDGTQQYQGTNTYFEWTNPAKIIEIVAYAGDKESNPKSFNFTPVSRTGQELWERSASGNSAYGWNSDGIGTSYSILDQNNFSQFDFYLDDLTSGSTDPANIYLVSPNYNAFGNPFNNTETAFAVGTADIAPAPGNYYTPTTQNPIVQGETYFLWIDHSANGWSDDDNFVKITINSIGSDGRVTFDYWFQKYGGLRWLKP